jgi:uncharacterized protein YecE (DUF72 family)
VKGQYYIGTSGWKCKHWKGTFYPEGLKDKDELNYYAQHFNTVEINSSYYHLPAATFEGLNLKSPASLFMIPPYRIQNSCRVPLRLSKK